MKYAKIIEKVSIKYCTLFFDYVECFGDNKTAFKEMLSIIERDYGCGDISFKVVDCTTHKINKALKEKKLKF